MRILIVTFLALILLSFKSDVPPVSWATTCDDCYVTSANLLDAVNEEIYTPKTTVPNTNNYLTRSQANALVELDPTISGSEYVLKRQLLPKEEVPHFYYPTIEVYTTNTSDAPNNQILIEATNPDGEWFGEDMSPPFSGNYEDAGVEAYYHTITIEVTNSSVYDINVHIGIDAVSGDEHIVNINFTVFASSSDSRQFTFPYTPTLYSPRILRLTCSEG